MMTHTHATIQTYAARFTAAPSGLLEKINENTWQECPMPQMISGHLQGRVLSMFSHMIKPKHILEIGTYTGYSALCLAEGLQKKGILHTIDKNETLEKRVRNIIYSL